MRSLVLTIIFITSAIALTVFWSASAFMNYKAGISYGTTPDEAQIYGAVSVASDVLKAALAFIISFCLLNNRHFAAALGLCFLIGTSIWSANSALRFASTNFIGTYEAKQVDALLTKKRFDQLDMESSHIKWLQKQTVSKYHKERKRMTAEINLARAALDKNIEILEKSDRTTLNASPHYMVLAAVTGFKETTILTIVTLFFTLLIEAVSSLGWYVLFNIHKKKDVGSKAKKKPTSKVIHSKVEPTQATQNHTSGGENVIKYPTQNHTSFKPKCEVNQWIKSNLKPTSSPTSTASDLYREYCRAGGELSQPQFGKKLKNKFSCKRFANCIRYHAVYKPAQNLQAA